MSELSVTFYGCEYDEQTAFLNMSSKFGITPLVTSENISENNINLSAGSQCVSVGHKKRVSRNIISALKKIGVQYINTRSIGVNHIDMQAAKEMGIVVENVMYSASSVADYTLMLILMVVRNMKSTMNHVEKNNFSLSNHRGKELQNLTIGVLGAGHIGQAVIDRLHGFGCKVLVHNRNVNKTKDSVSFQELLEKSDVLTIHVPLSTQTYHMFDTEEFERMKPGAYLINTARGEIIKTSALISSLEKGLLAGAALDVLEGEDGIFYEDYTQKKVPNVYLSQLQQMPNVILTPHTAYYTQQALCDIVEQTLINCKKIERS